MNKWLNSFINAWNLLIEIPIPESRTDDSIPDDENRILACFSLVGFAIGLICLFIIYVLSGFSGLGSSAVSSIIISIFIEIVTGGKNLVLLGNILEKTVRRFEGDRSSFELESASFISPMALLFTVSLFLLRVFSVSALISSGHANWLIIAYLASFCCQSDLAIAARKQNKGRFIDGDQKGVFYAWSLAIVIGLFSFNKVIAFICCFAIIYLLFRLFKNYCENKLGGVDGQLIGISGTVAELLVLVYGITFIIN